MTALPVIRPPATEVPTCCAPAPSESEEVSTRFHFSLNVSDLARSVAFYEKLFGESPSKNHEDYAKFEIDDPPLVFSLAPISPASDGSLSYLGFPCSSIDEVEATARRLDFVGI